MNDFVLAGFVDELQKIGGVSEEKLRHLSGGGGWGTWDSSPRQNLEETWADQRHISKIQGQVYAGKAKNTAKRTKDYVIKDKLENPVVERRVIPSHSTVVHDKVTGERFDLRSPDVMKLMDRNPGFRNKMEYLNKLQEASKRPHTVPIHKGGMEASDSLGRSLSNLKLRKGTGFNIATLLGTDAASTARNIMEEYHAQHDPRGYAKLEDAVINEPKAAEAAAKKARLAKSIANIQRPPSMGLSTAAKTLSKIV